MQSFTDAFNQKWTIDLNISTARAIRSRMAKDSRFDQYDFLDYAGILAAVYDVFFAADLLYVVCYDEAQHREMTSEDFGKALKGKILFDAIAAFIAEYLDFFPDPTTAQKMREVVERTKERNDALRDAILAAWENRVQEVVKEATERIQEI